MKAILIDDEPLARILVREYLQNHPDIEVIAECNDGFEGVKAVNQLHPDLLFLDIQMPKINGFEMLELVEQPPAVIFTTAFDEYAIKAFEAHAVDYLLKPFSQDRFDKAVDKFRQQAGQQKEATEKLLQDSPKLPSQSERIVVKNGGKIKIIPVPSILYLEAADDYVRIVTPEGSFLKNKTMGFYEKHLPPDSFVRIHRSYIINVQEITRIDPYEKESHLAILKSTERLPVSKSGYQKLKTILGL
ncbi:LytR/AlgR family response regulator transcription factor [Flavisolibacter nicotianae]|uniref:LytR/AlgR family response regulator transcription factor n=1 Tax=Flavisolibacter nicotianae TaxID=2364882 RepID=UPI000EB56945|nr:LytTR family transcriptional regulator DNA-binding domain-containing protein [Flavisolibacter nicotianae]